VESDLDLHPYTGDALARNFRAAGFYSMSAVLLAFGFSWMIVSALIGLVLGAGHDGHISRLAAQAGQGDLLGHNREAQTFKTRATAHGHSFLFAVVTVLIALVVERLPYPGTLLWTISGVLIAAAVLWTGAALKPIRVLMGVADVALLIVLATVAAGLVMNAYLLAH